MTRIPVQKKSGAAPIAPLSPAVWAGDLLYLSGQIPMDPATGQLVGGDVAAQTNRVFDNLEAVLRDAGLTLDDVIKVNVYLTDMSSFAAMNAAYAARFTQPYPARTTVGVKELPRSAPLEIEMVAKRP